MPISSGESYFPPRPISSKQNDLVINTYTREDIFLSCSGVTDSYRHDMDEQTALGFVNTVKELARKRYQGSSSNAQQNLRILAEEGYAAFTKLFPDANLRQNINRSLDASNPALIQVATKDFMLPWEFIYSTNPSGKQIDINKFWGMRNIIARTKTDAHAGDYTAVEGLIGIVNPKLHLLTNTDLKAVKTKEIPFFESLRDNTRLDLSSLRALERNDRNGELEIFKTFLESDTHILHFACHGQTGMATYRIGLNISSNFFISVAELVNRAPDLSKSNPLVVLNACNTGELDPEKALALSSVFAKLGAAGVVSSEFEINDDLAATFSSYFYPPLLEGHTIGESLLKARWELWQRHHSLAGLLYSIYGSSQIRLSYDQAYSSHFIELAKEVMMDEDRTYIEVAVVEDVRSNYVYEKLDVSELAANVKEFVSKIDKILTDIPEAIGKNFELSEFEVSTEVSTSGEIKIFGSGVEVGAKGGLSFKFSRKNSKA